MEDKIILVSKGGRTSVHIDVKIDDAGDLVFSGQDIGVGPSAFVGDSDYEYWLTVRKREKDRFLLLLIEKVFRNDKSVVSTVRDMLEENGVSYESFSY